VFYASSPYATGVDSYLNNSNHSRRNGTPDLSLAHSAKAQARKFARTRRLAAKVGCLDIAGVTAGFDKQRLQLFYGVLGDADACFTFGNSHFPDVTKELCPVIFLI
jgi:hypothetical protein